MLTRIYGTAWATQDDLDAYLHRLEEAEKRDHRRLGRELDLFSVPGGARAGLWSGTRRAGPSASSSRTTCATCTSPRGYDLVVTPHIARSVLWETTGHLEKYADNMYPQMRTETGDYYVKPMNCPFHVLVYKSQTRSYRELPMRLSELGRSTGTSGSAPCTACCGSAAGRWTTRTSSAARTSSSTRSCASSSSRSRSIATFGFTEPVVELSTLPGETIVTPEMAERATGALRDALERSGLEYQVAEGEGSFYGPKVDFHFRDAIGRLWQLTTVQCDFGLPERFEMEYVGEDNQRHRPVMIHRAILGSIERFTAVLIEHYAGAFPLWLSPEQVRLVPVADRHLEHARELASRLREVGLRPEVDESGETVGKKVRAGAAREGALRARDRRQGDRVGRAHGARPRGHRDQGRAVRRVRGGAGRGGGPGASSQSRFGEGAPGDGVERIWSPWRMEYIQAAKEQGDDDGLHLLRPAGRGRRRADEDPRRAASSRS